MDDTPGLPRAVWVGLGLMFGLLALAFFGSVMQVVRVQSRLNLPVLGPVADFTLTNQDGQPVTLAALTNHAWVADIIFTRCAGPCPRMTGQMKSLQDRLADRPQVKLVTLTTDPEFDSPTVMKHYGEHFAADFNRWTFLTGSKAGIAGLAGNSLKLSQLPVPAEQRKDAADLFIHSTIFVAVDKHARLRGVFETGGDGVDWTNDIQPRLVRALHQLDEEP